MALIIWEDAFSVGVRALDIDHMILMSLMNHIDDAKRHGRDETAVGALVGALIHCAHRHFRREEALMAKAGYPEREPHTSEHRLVEQQLAELHDAYQRTPDPEISHEIMALLNLWLTRHILQIDLRYRPHLAALDDGAG